MTKNEKKSAIAEWITKGLKSYAFNLTRDANDAEDLVQDTCLNIFKVWARYESSSVSDLKKIAMVAMKNQFLTNMRNKKGKTFYPVENVVNEVATATAPAEHDEMKRILGSLYGENSKKFVALQMHYEGFKQQEIAERLGTTRSAVACMTRYARIAMASRFAVYGKKYKKFIR